MQSKRPTQLPAAHILPALEVESKKQALQALAELAAPKIGRSPHLVFDLLNAREKLGSTGVGKGVALPHARLADGDKLLAFFARLSAPVEFDSTDGAPVDLIFMLLSPQEAGADHLQALSRAASQLRNPEFCARLRAAPDAAALAALLAGPPSKEAEAAA